jgi:Zn-dependent protease with chaperone function
MLAALQATNVQGVRSLALLPAIRVVSYFYEAFDVAQSRHSQRRELAADADGATVASTAAMASALVKVHAFSRLWQVVQESAVDTLKGGEVYIDLSSQFAHVISENATVDSFDGIGYDHQAHPTDSHPSLETRLEALRTTLSLSAPEGLAVTPEPSAISLIDNVETLEEDLSDTYQRYLAKRAGIEPESRAESTTAV